jgi:FMN-dependent oxidoreductase (nitrilotriacetate monooxygenase family)
MFHLGWFLGSSFGIQPWFGPWSGTNATDWMKPDIYRDLTRALERACVDYMFIEDTAMVEDSYKGSAETSLRYGFMAPKNDPLPLVPLLAQDTKHIGILATISASQYPPFLAARLMATLDHLTNGRAGVNVVTSVSHRAAQNYGLSQHYEHDHRYERADEWLEVVTQLWDSWEPDAIVNDRDEPRYVDHTKVHTIDFEGSFFKCRGPLNTLPGPQGRPVIAQAGSSPPGRELAAKYADTMLALPTSIEAMKSLRADMHRRLRAHGRRPKDLKILYLIVPVLGETDEEAQERVRRARANTQNEAHIDEKLWVLSYASGGIDFSQFDLDAPIPAIVGTGERSMISHIRALAEGKTLREALDTNWFGEDLDLVGSPDTVAAKMGEIMEEVGGDGFMFENEITRRSIAEVTDGLVPALQRRGLTRTQYNSELFRENLLAF